MESPPATISTIEGYRARKQAQKIIEDLDAILKILTISRQALSAFIHYIPARDAAIAISDNETLIRIHLAKYKKILDRAD